MDIAILSPSNTSPSVRLLCSICNTGHNKWTVKTLYNVTLYNKIFYVQSAIHESINVLIDLENQNF